MKTKGRRKSENVTDLRHQARPYNYTKGSDGSATLVRHAGKYGGEYLANRRTYDNAAKSGGITEKQAREMAARNTADKAGFDAYVQGNDGKAKKAASMEGAGKVIMKGWAEELQKVEKAIRKTQKKYK